MQGRCIDTLGIVQMNEAQQLGKGSANALVLYQPAGPDPVCAGPAISRPPVAGRVLAALRAGLVIWGGVSLAGVAGAAILYGNGGLGAGSDITAAQPRLSGSV